MKNPMKKIVSLALAAGLVLASFAGCGNNSTSESGSASVDSSKIQPVTFPITDKDIELSIFVSTRPNVDDYNNNVMTDMMEEKTGLKLNFDVANGSDAQTKLNTLLSTGDYPDLIFVSNLSLDLQSLYGAQGSLIALNPYIDAIGTNTKKVMEDIPSIKQVYTMDDGNIYNLPAAGNAYHSCATQKYWINKDWMDKLGLEMPKTTDDFEKVLKAFKEQDPNGNGIADEIPLSGCRKSWNAEVESFLMNAFTYTSFNQNGRWLQLQDGKVTASYMTDEWKDGLKYLNKLNSEGLLDSEAFTLDSDGLKRLGENPETEILGCFPGGSFTTGLNASGERRKHYVAVEPLTGPNGVSYCYYEPQSGSGQPGASITDHCKNPTEAFAMLDLMYDREISLWNTVGQKGVTWDDLSDDTDKISYTGGKATYIQYEGKEIPQNSYWNQMGNRYVDSTLHGQRASDDPTSGEKILYDATKNLYEPHFPDESVPMPKLVLTSDQSNELLTYTTTINNYAEEYLVDCILGTKDIDSTWDGYINELKGQGVEEMLKIYQEGYDDKYKK